MADDAAERTKALAKTKRYHPQGLGAPGRTPKVAGTMEGVLLLALRNNPEYVPQADEMRTRAHRRAYARARQRAGLPAEFTMPPEAAPEID